MVKKVIRGKKKGMIFMNTSSMGVILCAKGAAAKSIRADMQNPNINRELLNKSAKVAKLFQKETSSK